MDSSLQSRSPDNYDVKPSFRKPSNDAANRKYRRRSPVGGSASSSPGSPNSVRSQSPKEDSRKVSDDGRRKKDDGRDMDMDTNRSRSGKDNELYRHSERHYGNSRDYRKHLNDDYKRHHRHVDEDERSYQRFSSRSGRESRGSTRYDHTKHENDYDRSRDKYSRDRRDDKGHSKDKERETAILEHHRDRDKESGIRQTSSSIDERTGDRDRYRDRGGRDEKRDQRKGLGDYKIDDASSYDELRGQAKDSTTGRDKGSHRLKEPDRSSNKDLNEQKEDLIHKRKYVEREHDKKRERYTKEPEEYFQNDNRSSSSHRDRSEKHEQYRDKTIHVNEDHDYLTKKPKLDKASDDGQVPPKSGKVSADEKPPSSSRQNQENPTKVNPETSHSSASETDTVNDLNAAKVAAMKAAELVNRNLVGGGFMSTDQKKKLLWGNKKNTATEESGNRWDMPLFTDRERQEKFNKLMGVKGDLKAEHKPEGSDGTSLQRAEKQKELQLDLEKQYTAGLRRRDGRTVGLGL